MTIEKICTKPIGESMKVLVDTNNLLDCLLQRPNLYDSSKLVVQHCLFTVQGYIAAHAFSDMFYVLHERENRSLEYCRNTFIKLCQTFEISNVDKQRIIDASNNLKFNDFEDALQDSCALYSDVDYIITRNVDDFKNSSVPILRPEEFINMIKER